MSASIRGGFPEPHREVVDTTGTRRSCGRTAFAPNQGEDPGTPAYGSRTSWLTIHNEGAQVVRVYFRKAAFDADNPVTTISTGFIR